jgi:hypothetical protein
MMESPNNNQVNEALRKEILEFLADYAFDYPETSPYADNVEAVFNALVEAQSWCRVDAEASSARLGGSPTQDMLDARVERLNDVLGHDEKNNDKATLREIVLWTLDRHRNDVGDYLDLSDEELQAVYARAKKGEEA